MRNEQFPAARQSLYGQIQLEERVSTHKLSSPLKWFRASWVSTRQWTRTVLNSLINLSSSSALGAQLRDFDRGVESGSTVWKLVHLHRHCVDKYFLLHTLQPVDNVIPFQLQAEDLGLMTCCGGLLLSCDRGTYCTLENLVWQRL